MEKEVFERMLAEFNDLNEKVTNCRNFLLDEERSKVLDALNRDLLVAQLKNMEGYLAILSIRIGYNAPKEMISEMATEQMNEEAVTPEVVND